VRWRLDRILTLDMIRAPDLDGAEVFSALSHVSGGPGFDADFHPERLAWFNLKQLRTFTAIAQRQTRMSYYASITAAAVAFLVLTSGAGAYRISAVASRAGVGRGGQRDDVVAGLLAEDGHMIGDRWGVSESETLRSYPCDDFVASPTMQAWRGVSVEAPAEAVWSWVVQVRLAPYSYDWIDNCGRRSPRDLVGLPEPEVGDRFTAAGGREVGRIVSVDPGRQLTGTIMGAFMSYVLVPQEDDVTRLLLKVLTRTTRWTALGLCIGDLIMARRQLLNLKQLAERHQHQVTAWG
jgi:hypothetical protein